MKAEDFDDYARSLGYTVEVVTGEDGLSYSVVRGLTIPKGRLAGQICDIGIHRSEAEPYVVPAAIHTRPHLVAMAGVPLATQQSKIGQDWQYWSRRYDRVPTPKGLWTHVLTVLGEVT